ncbi:solute carrier family 2, facilitated glucose transporter member 6 [Drosophila eugracilis]|uniref:solute carrier family 2, facilitated glucose transporter member 6 n=1 Tax=Drosophila eugracilis TaxID=29029 RepID=UPI0007E7FF3D|nr:solute carrier family 2, facilitated glucose transporter member 6 [Drosophila eugracilis]XP_017077507.1 solute carrier family 2, facilitated glucose transporter member 6 [Drosophila eugracilis]
MNAEDQHLNQNGNEANGKQAKIVSGLDRPLKTPPPGEQTRAVRRQVIAVILANVGVFSTGMTLAMPTATMYQLKDITEPVHLEGSQFTWFASVNALSAPLGGLLSAFLLDRIGRKRSLIVLNVLTIVAWILLATPSQSDSKAFFWQLIASRFLLGIGMGLASAPPGVYAAEISVPKTRGSLILGTSISVAGGITILYAIGYCIRDDFRLIALICCGYQLVSLLCVLPLMESHCWLLSKKRVTEAKRSLNYFRGFNKSDEITHPQVLEEFQLLQKALQKRDMEVKKPFWKSVKEPEVHKPLLILMSLFAFQQLTGIFVVIVFAVQISSEAGIQIDPFMCALFIGLARLVTTCPMGYILEMWGRRRAGIISTLGMAVCMFLLAGHSKIEFLKAVPYLPVIAIVGFIVLSTLGLYTLPFFMISELFPQRVRGPASGLTVAVGMFISFVVLKTYPDFKESVGMSNCFIFFGVMAVLALIFIYWALPETRRRTLLEIEEQFRSGHSRKSQNPVDVEMKEVFVRKPEE